MASARTGDASRRRRSSGPATSLPRRDGCRVPPRRSPGEIDVAAAFAQRDYMTNNWTDDGQQRWLESEGIDFYRGAGRLTGERAVEVTAADGTATALTAERAVVIATGTGPTVPPIEGLADVAPWDNRSVTAAKELPRRLLVLGGGAIGAEMAQGFKRLGCDEVTVVEGGPRLLAREEPFAGDEVCAAFAAEGIVVHAGVHDDRRAPVRHRRPGRASRSTTAPRSRATRCWSRSAAGPPRRPSASTWSVSPPASSSRSTTSSEQSACRASWLYAVGDCNGRALLTHMGKYQARIAADVILGQGRIRRRRPRHGPARDVHRSSGVCGRAHRGASAREGRQRSRS